MDEPKTSTWRVQWNGKNDFQRFAKEFLGFELSPYQLNLAEDIAKGNVVMIRRIAGFNTVTQVMMAYMQADSHIKHFDKTHFRATTIGDRKFTYCPVGNICSWSEGDYDNKLCHWCKKYFNEIGA